ncbi:MAG: eukaryotic-like serine/threonine-protein kinase, partial [Solirubrobacteraceae bacterium]|nr:eukaryotic-like serine/threonine-protein kinase [Solirubrobacteraceae bacterium]
MEFRILGPLEVLSGGRALDIGGHKQSAVLALLLLEANRAVSRDGMIDALWEDDPPETAQKALQVYISRLRKLLGRERVETRSPGYLLRVDSDELDLARFRRLAAEGRPEEALSLWRGPPLAEFARERFAQPAIARLEELHLTCLEERGERELARGRHAELAGELDALVAEHPLREGFRAQQMLCLYRCERQADALEAYREARSALVDELGIEPGRRLRELHQAILEQDPALEVAAAPDPTRRARDGTFVGREAELAELVGGLDDAFAARGRLFLLVGEPGIGKSRLAEELIARAEDRGARVLVGRCWEAGGAPVYWPWVQSLRTYVRETDPTLLRAQLGAGAADLAQIVPELRERLSATGEPVAGDAEAARFRLFDATAQFLRRASESRPIVLVLDDLHAADASSLLLLQFVARELGAARILLLAACRDVDPVPGPALAQMLAEVGREPGTRRLDVAGLSEAELEDFVGLETAAPVAVGALHEQTGGNPLFAGEIVRLQSVEGRRSVPQSVRAVIARRLTHLSEACNRALVLASVLGREFAIDALARLSDVSEDELLDLLDEAITARVVSDVPGVPGRARFAHVLIRDTLYEGLSGARRVMLHRRAVDALETLYGDESGPHLAELAHHAIAGRDDERAVDYATRAADRALASLADEEAARQYETALAALGDSDESTRCRLLLSLGEAESRAGNGSAAKAALLAAARIARRLGLAPELARAAAEYGGRIVYARASADEQLLPLLEEGLAALGEEDVDLRVRLLARLAGALRDEPSRSRRDTLSREAVTHARRASNDAALAYALDGRAIAIVAPDTFGEVISIGRELREIAERIGDRERVVHGYMHALGPLLAMGEIDAARRELEAAEHVARELRQPAHLWDVGGAAAMLALSDGRLAEAEALVEEVRELGERVQPDMAVPVYVMQRYTLCEFRGRLEEIEPAIVDLVARHPSRQVFRCVLAHLQARLGRLPEAGRTLHELARDRFAALPFDQEWLFGMSFLAEAAGLVGDAGAATVLHELLVPWAGLNVVDQCEGMRGSVSRYLGILAASAQRFEEAERHFEAALATNTRTAALPWLAYSQTDYARMLDARGGAGD